MISLTCMIQKHAILLIMIVIVSRDVRTSRSARLYQSIIYNVVLNISTFNGCYMCAFIAWQSNAWLKIYQPSECLCCLTSSTYVSVCSLSPPLSGSLYIYSNSIAHCFTHGYATYTSKFLNILPTEWAAIFWLTASRFLQFLRDMTLLLNKRGSLVLDSNVPPGFYWILTCWCKYT